jgi:hypothetical protein
LLSADRSQNDDTLPRSFLQLKGILVGNFNMGCNFHISAALMIMMQYNITILAIQEHTAWSRKLLDGEIISIERHCDMREYWVNISKLQILIMDKQISACHREMYIYEEGRVIHCLMEVAKKQFVSFIPVYGIPHSTGEKIHLNQDLTRDDKME